MDAFYIFLSDNQYFWDRKDSKHIWVALDGYRCYDERRLALDEAAKAAKATLVSDSFDKQCGKTFYVFKHK